MESRRGKIIDADDGSLLCRAQELIFYLAVCTRGLYLGVQHGDKFDPLTIVFSYLKSTV